MSISTTTRVIALLREHFNRYQADIRGDTPLEMLVVDSFDFAEFVVMLEKEFNIGRITTDFNDVQTVDDVARFLDSLKP